MKTFMFMLLVLVAGCTSELLEARRDTNQVIIRDPQQRAVPLAEIEQISLTPTLRGFWQYGLLSATARHPERINLENLCTFRSRYVARWKRVMKYSEIEIPPVRQDDYGFKIPGFGYSVWEDTSRKRPKRVAVVFRGTDFDEWGDWYSSARWITRFNPLSWDQYQQTRALMSTLVGKLHKKFGNDVEIVATGHSLGGGLAQHAAYSSPHINTVYAFASSPVTGASSLDRRVDPTGVMTFRVYESGEILSAFRWVSRKFAPLTVKDPDVKEARFNFRRSLNRKVRGSEAISQHGIQQFTCDLICRVEKRLSTKTCNTRAEVNLAKR